MVKLISRITGYEMWVADNRVDEYLAEGNEIAVVVPVAPPLEKPVTKKKATKKKK